MDVNAVPALRVLCPTIFLSGLLGVFRGYFQAHKTTIYTSVSQIIEQIFNAVVALLAAYIFIQPYLGVDAWMMQELFEVAKEEVQGAVFP